MDTALFLRGTIKKESKKVFLSKERSSSAIAEYNITQESIDKAFAKDGRITSKNSHISGKETVYIETGHYNNLGIDSSLGIADIERSLIDIAIRPHYYNSIDEIIDIFREVKGKLDIQKLKEYLEKMKFIYPYGQRIGYILEIAGYDKKQYQLFKNMNMEFDFYLQHGSKRVEFNNRWRLWIN
jgi:predicted transcriptional regulator of viral defense system